MLHDDERRKRSFGLDAELYDASRHRYPAALFDRIIAYAGLTPVSRVLEVGSGTGIATLPFAERGFAIDCVELSDAMANVARAKLAAFPRVRVHTTTFENFNAAPASFDAVTCAQAWHWIAPDVRYRRAHSVLRAGGTLAIFANWDAALLDVVQPVYARHGLAEPRGGVPAAWSERDPVDIETSIGDVRASIEDAGGFGDIEFHRYPWSRTFTASEYVALLRTISDISTRPVEVLEPFLHDVSVAIEAEGSVTRHYEAVLMLART